MNQHFAQATHDLHTVRDWLRFAVSHFYQAELFFGHGSSDAYDEAAYLILHTLHLPLDRLEPFLDARLTGGERVEVLNIIQRRVQERVPAAYLTNEAFLGEFSFYVDERVIVPRSFIAELLRTQLSPWVAESEAIDSVLTCVRVAVVSRFWQRTNFLMHTSMRSIYRPTHWPSRRTMSPTTVCKTACN